MGNKKRMVKVNGEYISGYLREWCKLHSRTMTSLSEDIGHAPSYIQLACKTGTIPPAELELLVRFTGMEREKALYREEAEEPEETKSIEEKLDYIITLLEKLTQPNFTLTL